MTWAQGVALACAAGLVVAAAGFFMPTFAAALEWLTGVSVPSAAWALPAIGLPEHPLANPVILAAVAALGLSAIVLPVVLYFTFRED